jgi:ribonuclease VapC
MIAEVPAATGTAVVIDTSAIVAILRSEPEATDLFERAMAYDRRAMATPTWLETAIVCEGRNALGGDIFDQFVSQLRIEVLPFTQEQAAIARQAYRKYGKGRGSPAKLSYGDCFAYALAQDLGAPLLFKGEDFVHTDIAIA